MRLLPSSPESGRLSRRIPLAQQTPKRGASLTPAKKPKTTTLLAAERLPKATEELLGKVAIEPFIKGSLYQEFATEALQSARRQRQDTLDEIDAVQILLKRKKAIPIYPLSQYVNQLRTQYNDRLHVLGKVTATLLPVSI